MQSRRGDKLNTLMKPEPTTAFTFLRGTEMWREREAMERLATLMSKEDYFTPESLPSLVPHYCGQ